MRQLRIKRLALVNFKGIRHAEATFTEAGATISGDNGVGKSTMADAFSWLLFGKNAAGDTDQRFSIKTVDASGAFIPDLEHTVEGDFTLVDTETAEVKEIRMRRSLVEDWKTAPGETGRTLKGHHTDDYGGDIPVKKSEYEANVAEAIPAEVFKVITDPYAFLALPWETMRNKLTEITGDVKPEDVARGVADFEALLNQLSGATLEQYRQAIGAQRKRVVAELDAIPTRKDELTRATPETPDYTALEARRAELAKKIADLDAAAGSVAERRRLQYEQAGELQRQIGEQQKAQQAAIHEAEMARLEAENQQNRARREMEQRQDNLRRELRRIDQSAEGAKWMITQAETYNRDADNKEKKLAELRAQFQKLDASTYTPGALRCPRYGHICTDPEACSHGEAEFNESQAESLKALNREGCALRDGIKKLRDDAARMVSEYDASRAKNDALRDAKTAELDQVTIQLATLPPIASLPAVDPATLPKWRAAADQIAELTRQREAIMAAPVDGATAAPAYPDEKRHAQMELDEIARKLGLRAVIETNERRQKELDQQARTLAQEKANLEKKLATADAFSVALMDAVEQKVNQHFNTVQFRMFKTLVNGTKQPDCIATVNGVHYRDVNTAGQINAGLDIIETLTRFHQYTAPIFVDNCESVARLRIPEGSQVIRLEFKAGQPLTVTPMAALAAPA